MGKIVSVINQKGGVGKTTTAVNLAHAFAQRGKSVLMVDLDPQANATSGCGLEPDQGFTDDLLRGSDPKGLIKVTDYGFDVIASRPSLSQLEHELSTVDNKEYALRARLEGLEYDLIIIDCPPALGLLSVNALCASHGVIIPVQGEYYALEGLSQLLSTIQLVKNSLHPGLSIWGLVITMYDKRTALSADVRKQLEASFGSLLLKTSIPRNVRLAEAPSYGKPVLAYDKRSKGAKAYKALAKELSSHV